RSSNCDAPPGLDNIDWTDLQRSQQAHSGHSESWSSAQPGGQRINTERVFGWWDYPVFIVLTLVTLTTLAGFLVYWFALDWQLAPGIFMVLSLLLGFNLAVQQLRWWSLPLMRRPRPLSAEPGYRVGVATTFVP